MYFFEDVDSTNEPVSRPPALPELPRMRESSILVQPCAYMPSKISPPSSACGPDTAMSHGPSSRMYVCEPTAAFWANEIHDATIGSGHRCRQ
jgi:hypothetical protein